MWSVTGATINGQEWAWIAVPLAAFAAGVVKYGLASLKWLRGMEREAGRSAEYERLSTITVAQLERTVEAKNAELKLKDEEITTLRATIAQGKEAPR